MMMIDKKKEDGSVYMNETKKGIKLKAFNYLEWETSRNKKKGVLLLFVWRERTEEN